MELSVSTPALTVSALQQHIKVNVGILDIVRTTSSTTDVLLRGQTGLVLSHPQAGVRNPLRQVVTVVYPDCGRGVNVPVDLLRVIGQRQEQHCHGHVLGMSDLKELMTSNTSRDPNSEDFREQSMFAGVQAQTGAIILDCLERVYDDAKRRSYVRKSHP